MGVVYDAATRTVRMQAVVTSIDSGPGAGTLEIGDAGFSNVLCIYTLADPSGTVSGDVVTGSGMPRTTTGLVTGNPDVARIKDSTGTVRVSDLTVGTTGANIIISPSDLITAGQTCNLTALILTHNTAGV